jgi:hypothetical protein
MPRFRLGLVNSSQANDGGCDGDECAVAFVGLAAAHGDAPVFIELSEEFLNQVPPVALLANRLCLNMCGRTVAFSPATILDGPSRAWRV